MSEKREEKGRKEKRGKRRDKKRRDLNMTVHNYSLSFQEVEQEHCSSLLKFPLLNIRSSDLSFSS
jgi:hypothetical protein